MAYAPYTLKLIRKELKNASGNAGIHGTSSEYLITTKLRTQLLKALDQLIHNEEGHRTDA